MMGKLDLFSVPLPLLPRCIWVWHEVGDVYIAACSGSITRVEGRQLVCSPEPESILGLATCTMLGIGSPTLFTDGMTRYVTGVPCGFGKWFCMARCLGPCRFAVYSAATLDWIIRLDLSWPVLLVYDGIVTITSIASN